MIVSLNNDVRYVRWQLTLRLLLLLEFNGLGAKVVRVDLNLIEVTRLVGEGLWDDMLLREVE